MAMGMVRDMPNVATKGVVQTTLNALISRIEHDSRLTILELSFRKEKVGVAYQK